MKAMVLHEIGPIEQAPLVWRPDYPDPEPGPDEVRVAAGCATPIFT